MDQEREQEYIKTALNLIFLVTAVGCGYAGGKVEDIAPLFKEAFSCFDIYLPFDFIEILKRPRNF